MDQKLLETVELQTAPNPDAAIIWLHGLGADGHDFVPIVPELVKPGERAWRFVFPHAETRPVTLNGGMHMRAWYDIVSLDRRAGEDAAGFAATDQSIRALIAREEQRGIASTRIVLAGFSQGGAVSLYTAPRLAQRLAGVMALSTYLPLAGRLTTERLPANQATPIFMAHGTSDGVLPIAMGRESRDVLRAQGFDVDWHEYPMAHSVCAPEVMDIRAFLLRVLPIVKVS
jgi:phospholipase/carboxylesterase